MCQSVCHVMSVSKFYTFWTVTHTSQSISFAKMKQTTDLWHKIIKVWKATNQHMSPLCPRPHPPSSEGKHVCYLRLGQNQVNLFTVSTCSGREKICNNSYKINTTEIIRKNPWPYSYRVFWHFTNLRSIEILSHMWHTEFLLKKVKMKYTVQQKLYNLCRAVDK